MMQCYQTRRGEGDTLCGWGSDSRVPRLEVLARGPGARQKMLRCNLDVAWAVLH